MTADFSHDVTVIGAGIAGVATAIHLQRRGRRVLLVDKSMPGHGTSLGNAGIIEASYVLPVKPPSVLSIPRFFAGRLPAARMNYPAGLRQIPFMLDLYYQALPKNRARSGRHVRPLAGTAMAEHEYLMAGTDARQYLVPSARVKIYRSEKTFQAAKAERLAADDCGVSYDVFSAAEFAQVDAAIKPNFHTAVRWNDSAYVRDPGRLVGIYAQKFIADGGVFQTVDVQALSPVSDGWGLKTNTSVIRSKDVVVCAGPWAESLLKPLGYRFSFGIKRGYHRHMSVRGPAPRHSILDVDIGYAASCMTTGLRITTGAEFADIDSQHNPVQLDQVLPFARQIFDIDSVSGDAPWCGARPCFADSLPAVGAAPRHAGLWVNIGHGHLGLTLGPATGRLISEMMTAEKTFCDPSPYSFSRVLS